MSKIEVEDLTQPLPRDSNVVMLVAQGIAESINIMRPFYRATSEEILEALIACSYALEWSFGAVGDKLSPQRISEIDNFALETSAKMIDNIKKSGMLEKIQEIREEVNVPKKDAQ